METSHQNPAGLVGSLIVAQGRGIVNVTPGRIAFCRAGRLRWFCARGFGGFFLTIAGGFRIICRLYPGVAQLVARLVRDQEAVGSNPATRTTEKVLKHKCFKAFSFSVVYRKPPIV